MERVVRHELYIYDKKDCEKWFRSFMVYIKNTKSKKNRKKYLFLIMPLWSFSFFFYLQLRQLPPLGLVHMESKKCPNPTHLSQI